MRWALLMLLALAAPAVAQAPSAGYEVRLGLGDIPSTPSVEPAGTWNLRIELAVAHTEGSVTAVAIPLPSTFVVASAGCGCTNASADLAEPVTITIGPDEASGTYEVFLDATGPAETAVALRIPLPAAAFPEDALVVVYPAGRVVESNLRFEAAGDRHAFQSSVERPLGTDGWLVVRPATGSAPSLPRDDGFNYLAVALGAMGGILLWALLVQRGVVQRRSRKQVAQEAPHAALAKEGRAALEARKRALMAGLKELELAKQDQQVETAAYDLAKADLKRQAVAVMRALEQLEASDAKP